MTAPDNNAATTAVAPDRTFRKRRDRSMLSRAALRAAAESDRIPVEDKWGAAWRLILIIGGSASIWGLLAAVKILFF